MAMQLFSFGHPCEHQLHRACIGGSNCPLNGYPDTWCCSFIKGKINFRRDRPCKGPRCHWDFVHPTQSQFDEVTQVLDQSRPIAAKLDEARDTDLLSFTINNPHIIDTVQCALHMMRHPPSSCARRVGQLLAYAAVLAGDQDVFVQLLKTMKKPVDGYILGAYAYLTQSKPNSATAGSEKGGTANQKAAGKKQNKKKDVKDDISATLANIMVELMNAALSLGGQLVDREDQHVLQAMLIKALSTYPKSDRRHQEMLEKAIAKFGNRKLDDEEEAAVKREAARREAAAVAAASKETANPTDGAAAPATTAGDEPTGASAAAEDTTAAAPTTATTTAAVEVPAANAEAPSSAAATPLKAPSAERETAAPIPPPPPPAAAAAAADPRSPHEEVFNGPAPPLPAAAAATPKMAFSSAPGTPGTAVVAAAVAATGPFNTPAVFSTIAQPTTAAAPPPNPAAVAAVTTPLFTTSTVTAGRPPTTSTTTPSVAVAAAPPQPPTATAPGPLVGISKVLHMFGEDPDAYFKSTLWEPASRSGPLANLYLCGGQFTVKSHLWGPTPLGDATPVPFMDAATKQLVSYLETMEATEAAAEEQRRAAQAADARIDELRRAWNWVDSDGSWCCYSESSEYWETGSESDE